MTFTTQLRNEHDLLLAQVEELETLGSGDFLNDFTQIFVVLGRFTQLLQIHLLREDSVLYPVMVTSADNRAATVAAAFQFELGALDKWVEAFESRWTGAAISSEWSTFCEELQDLLAAVRLRIERENDELYPLFEAETLMLA